MKRFKNNKVIKDLIVTASCLYIGLEFVLSLPILLIMYFTYTEKVVGVIMIILTLISFINILIFGEHYE